jgi:Putative restriction endonuclease
MATRQCKAQAAQQTPTGALDRGDKLKFYATEKVAHVWFVDPEALTLEVLTLDGAYAASAKVRAVPFDALELDLALRCLR